MSPAVVPRPSSGFVPNDCLQLIASLYDPVAGADVDLEFKSNMQAFKSGLELHLTLKTGHGEDAQVGPYPLHEYL